MAYNNAMMSFPRRSRALLLSLPTSSELVSFALPVSLPKAGPAAGGGGGMAESPAISSSSWKSRRHQSFSDSGQKEIGLGPGAVHTRKTHKIVAGNEASR